MIEVTTKTYAGEERRAVRWGPDGTSYVCAPDGDCTEASRKALDWARDNGVPESEIERAGTLLNPPARSGSGPVVVNIVPGSEERAARLRESRRRFTAP